MVSAPLVKKAIAKYYNPNINLLIVVTSAIFSALIYYVSGLFVGEPIKFGLLLITTLLLFLKIYDKQSNFVKSIIWGYILFLSSLSLYISMKVVRANIINPHEWDFLSFYLFGKVAINGSNFYNITNFLNVLSNITLPFTPSNSFINSTLAFQYLPPNIFYFIPLGLFDFNSANYVWLTINILFIFLDISLLYKLFFKTKKLLYFLGLLSLFLLLPGTQKALLFEQTTFICLFLLLIIWKNRDLPNSGIWLSIAMFTKPILAIFFIYPVLRRKWKTIIIAAITSLIIILVTLLIFGSSVFVTFFTRNPTLRVPNTTYTEWVNQSLLATILRVTNYDFSYVTPLIHPLFLISAFFLTAISFWITFKIDVDKSEWAFAIIILLALMIYPGSINSYGPMIIPVIILLLMDSKKLLNGGWLYIISITAVYSIMYINPFVSYLFLWSTLVLVVFTNSELKSGLKPVILKKLRTH